MFVCKDVCIWNMKDFSRISFLIIAPFILNPWKIDKTAVTFIRSYSVLKQKQMPALFPYQSDGC